MTGLMKGQREFVGLGDVEIPGQRRVPSVLPELGVVVRRGGSSSEQTSEGPSSLLLTISFSPSSTKEPLATSMTIMVHTRKSPSSLPQSSPLSGTPWAQQHLPKGDNEGRFLIKGRGQRTPRLHQEMGRQWSKVRCSGQKNTLRSLQETGRGEMWSWLSEAPE